jgi:hypothetical protein
VLALALTFSSCGRPDVSAQGDFGAPADLAVSLDFAWTPDLAVSPDFSEPPDLALDLAEPPDLAVALDIAEPLDLSVALDLMPAADLSLSSDGGAICIGTVTPVDSGAPGDLAFFPFTSCSIYGSCNGYAQLAGWDPCQPLGCSPPLTGFCFQIFPAGAPDGTPCDDGNACTSAAPSTCTNDSQCTNGGTPSCVGGDRNGRNCTTDDDCTPRRAGPCRATCSNDATKPCNLDADCGAGNRCSGPGRCNAGIFRGSACTTNSDCDGGCRKTCSNAPTTHCVADSQCGAGTCTGPRTCAGGTTPNASCASNAGCPGGFPDFSGGSRLGMGVGGCQFVCASGHADDGNPCFPESELIDCPIGGAGACVGGPQCNGGLLDGTSCTNASDCVAAKCVKWSCDPVNQWCVAQSGIPSCPNGQSDCDLSPYSKFCARDPDYYVARWNNGSANQPGVDDPNCATNGTCPNTCHLSASGVFPGADYGPAVTYTCNTATHQCLNSSVPCLGGAKGAGSVCNNVCRSGVCSSDFTH